MIDHDTDITEVQCYVNMGEGLLKQIALPETSTSRKATTTWMAAHKSWKPEVNSTTFTQLNSLESVFPGGSVGIFHFQVVCPVFAPFRQFVLITLTKGQLCLS